MIYFSIALVIIASLAYAAYLKELQFRGLSQQYMQEITNLNVKMDKVIALPSHNDADIKLIFDRISTLEMGIGMTRNR